MSRREIAKRWSAEEARAVLGEFASSGLTLEEFARSQGLCSQRLRWWRKRLGGGHVVGAVLPVRVVQSAQKPVVAVEVALRSGHVMRVLGFDVESLQALIAALEGSC